jgi:hypothetical protein
MSGSHGGEYEALPCSLVEVNRRFRGANYLHHQRVESHYIDDGECNLHTCLREHLKPHVTTED